jgi:hypothetical protein
MSPISSKYGSIPITSYSGSEDEESAEPYPIENTQYIKPTAEENRKKCVASIVPVTMFVLIMGGLAFALSRDFDHLYPSRHGPHTNRQGPTTSVTTETTDSIDFSHAGCSIHNSCVALGLTGSCCPTPKGIVLECCKD